MVQFLTTIPLPVKLEVKEEDFGKGLVFAPVVGLLLGCILAGAYFLLSFLFPAAVTSVLVMVVYILLTGGIHLDGLGDTFDGIFSNRPREKMLEIMRDSRVGTNAVLAVASLLLLNSALLASFDGQSAVYVLVLMPAAGRIGSLLGSGISTYARSGAGLGKSFIEYCGKREVIAGTIIYGMIFYAVKGLEGLLWCTIPYAAAIASTKFFSRKIGGTTGDILGAVCEINQTLFLAAAYLFIKL